MNNLATNFGNLWRSIDNSNKKRITFLGILFLLVSIILPFTILYKFQINELTIDAWKSNDMEFHFMRIEGLVNSLKNFEYPSLVNMFGFSNSGQLVNGTYAWPTLLLFAIPRLFITNIPISYFISFVFIQFIGLSTFYSLIKYLYNRTTLAIFGAFIFSTSPIYLEEMYERFDLGSFISYIFFPLIILGLLYIFSSKMYQSMLKGSFILAFGLSLVANSHIISLLFAVIGVSLFFIYKIFTGEVSFKKFKYLMLGIGMSLLMSIQSWGSVIMITLNQKFVRPDDTVKMSDHSIIGVNLIEGIVNDFRNYISGGHSTYHLGIMIMILGVAIPLVFYTRTRNMKRYVVILFVLSLFLIFASSSFFPWKLIADSPIKVIQFPSRLLIPATIFLTIVATFVFNRFRESVLSVLSIIIILVGVNSLQILGKNLETANPKINTQLSQSASNQLKYTSLPTSEHSKNYKKIATNGRHVSNDYYPYDGKTPHSEYKKMTNQIRLSKTNPDDVNRQVVAVSTRQNKYIYTTNKVGDVTIPFLKYNFMNYEFKNNGKKIEPSGISKASSFIIPMKKGENHLTITIHDPSWYVLLALVMWISILVIFVIFLQQFRSKNKKITSTYDQSRLNNEQPKREIMRF